MSSLFARFVLVFAFVAGLSVAGQLPATASAEGETEGNIKGLRNTLRVGLRARRDVEFQFIDKVVDHVKHDHLTRKMVLETYTWARKKVGLFRTRYPFPYFEAAMRKRAAGVGVKL